MIRYHTNKELADKLHINLAKWKRWSREFLPPDPLGGLQSGYARHYKTDDAFTVVLGGHLVSELRFSIPQAKTILTDLQQWLLDLRFYFDYESRANPLADIHASVQSYTIYIIPLSLTRQHAAVFNYILHGFIGKQSHIVDDLPLISERFVEQTHPKNDPDIFLHTRPVLRALNITALHNWFHDRLTANG